MILDLSSGPEVTKLISGSTRLSIKLKLLINDEIAQIEISGLDHQSL